MIWKILISKGQSGFKAASIILLGILAAALLIQYFGFNYRLSLIDASLNVFLVVGGFLLLDNIFGFYVPQKSQRWLIVAMPLIFSVSTTFLSRYLLKLILVSETDYLHFVDYSIPVRLFLFFILYLSWAILLFFNRKLEDQIKTKERQEKIQQMSKEAELFHLRQQLQPHFIFNSLNSISALVKSNPDKAREMVVQLADFLRKTIKKNDQKWVKVEEELEYLDLFLSIEKVRFGHRLKTEIELSEESKDLKIPQLLIQPLLENAIKHGLYGVLEDVLIQIKFAEKDKYLLVSVTNPFELNPVKSKGLGFGLEAVKRRLYLMFGRHDLIEIENNNGLFKVTLKIPQHYD
ncbi:sensor histidine kinase [Shivajiella indica]|uniref:Sensor histidine kinase n=1 Tax=Shivajiella indica TaxID=872115 RepID=A0ABW5BA83_9BACT